MQVNHTADHITHAFIGGHKTIEFGISNSAEFFQILSSTLYSDQHLAVAREVLCNAWDAHIRAGIQNTPIEVTITDDMICVLDHAYGIHPDRIGPLLGTYGGTDKTNNGQETGGFGLGFKAPFAYTDHFEVISCHRGTKTIYNVSKNSADKNGKPGITPIVVLPTTKTGLRVKIPLKELKDSRKFIDLFKHIARNGEMNVTVNGDPVDVLPMSKSQSNWLITTKYPLSSEERVFLRYGNVIYPVKRVLAYDDQYTKVRSFLFNLSGKHGHSQYNIIFQAEPNTISVTPSRESLSMQEHTKDTIRTLLDGFLNEKLDEQIAKESVDLLKLGIEKSIENRQIGDLMRDDRIMPGLTINTSIQDFTYITNASELAGQFTRQTYPKTDAFWRQDMELRIDAAITLGIGDRGHLNEVKRWTSKTTATRESTHYNYPYIWFKKRVLRPLYRDIVADPVMDIKRLFITTESNLDHLQNPLSYQKIVFSKYLPILRKIVVISYGKKDLYCNIRNHEKLKTLGKASDIWMYHAPNSKTKIQAIRDFFTKRGFILIDETAEEVMENKRAVSGYVPKAQRIVKPKALGLPALSGVYASGKTIRVDNCFDEGQPRVDNPLFFHQIEVSKASCRSFVLSHFGGTGALTIAKMFGDVCAVVRTKPAALKLKEAGLLELNEYVVNYVCDKVTTSPSFLAYWPESISRAIGEKDGRSRNELMTTLFDVPEVRSLHGLTSTLDAHDLMVVSLWRNMMDNHYHFSKDAKVQAAAKAITDMPVSPIVADIVLKVGTTGFTHLINMNVVQQIVRNTDSRLNGKLDVLAKLTHALLG